VGSSLGFAEPYVGRRTSVRVQRSGSPVWVSVVHSPFSFAGRGHLPAGLNCCPWQTCVRLPLLAPAKPMGARGHSWRERRRRSFVTSNLVRVFRGIVTRFPRGPTRVDEPARACSAPDRQLFRRTTRGTRTDTSPCESAMLTLRFSSARRSRAARACIFGPGRLAYVCRQVADRFGTSQAQLGHADAEWLSEGASPSSQVA
jgi:hypothetical protein